MNDQSNLLKHFRWRATLIRFLVNVVTLFIVVAVTPAVYFVDPTLLNLLLMALVLGILNATLKPIVQFFTLPFIFVSYGLIIVLINSLMLWLLAWFFPDILVIDRIFWALVAGALYGIISTFLESLCGLDEPIISDAPEVAELRARVEDESVGVVQALVEHQHPEVQPTAEMIPPAEDEKNLAEAASLSQTAAEMNVEATTGSDEAEVKS